MGDSLESQPDKITVGDPAVAAGQVSSHTLALYRDLHLIKSAGKTNASFTNLDTQALYPSDSSPRAVRTNLAQATEGRPQEVPAPKKPDATAQRVAFEESQYTPKKGDTSESLARHKLGPNASDAEVKAYAAAITEANKIDDPTKLESGKPLTLPARAADGSVSYVDGEDKTLKVVVHPDGTTDFSSTTSSAVVRRVPDKDDSTSYTDTHKGPNAEDNFTEHVKNHPDGRIEETRSDGTSYSRVPDEKDPNAYVETHKGTKPEDNYTLSQRADGSSEVKSADGTSYVRTPDAKDPNGYVEVGNGPLPENNYTRTQHGNGSFEVQLKNGQSYTHTPDPKDANAYVEVRKGPNPDDNYTFTQHGDGSSEHKGADGSSFVRTPDAKDPNGYVEVGKGPKPDDNYTQTMHGNGSFEAKYADGRSYTHTPDAKDPNNYVEVHKGAKPDDNYTFTQRADGSSEHQSQDGSSYVRTPDAKDPNNYTEVGKGPKPEDNYTEQMHGNGSFEVHFTNGKNYTHTPDANDPKGYVEVRKGPKPDDNYTFTQHADGSSDCKGVDGTSYVHTPDAKDPDGYVEIHKGPDPDDNFTKTMHGNGAFEVVGTDGTSCNHVPDQDNPQNYTETHHGPKPDDNYETHTFTNPDGSYQVENKTDGTSFTHVPDKDNPDVYREEHFGPKADDNYVRQQSADGSYEQTFSNGKNYTYTPDKDNPKRFTEQFRGPDSEDNYSIKGDGTGNWVKYDPNGKQIGSYDQKADTNTDIHDDGARVTTYNSDGHTVTTGTDGTVETKWKDGSFKEEHVDGTSKEHKVDASGNYTETGKGPKPSDNYTETYDITSGTTTRIEAKGTPQERTSTRTSDGTETVIAKDGDNYTRKADGSEHHWGKETFDKPAYDYTSVDKSRKGLDDAIHNAHPPISPEKQTKMEDDMAAFEKRAKEQHLPPEEVSKSYDQMTRVLTTPDKDAAMSPENRENLVQGFLHQSASPDQTDQGNHQTCNVTTEAENGFSKNPSKLAEIAATTAVTGKWVAPDGKVIEIDPKSLQPGAQEANYPPVDGARSYTTQVLNLVMVNDITQRRTPPQFYRQENATGGFVGDTGERLYDANGKVITEKVVDPNDPKKLKDQPINEPTVSEGEMAQSGKRVLGRDWDIIAVNRSDVGVQDVSSPEALQHIVKQKADQGKLPITIHVDANHAPIAEDDRQDPGYGSHVVTIDGYRPETGEVHVSNQWGTKSDKWMKPDDLYKNSSGEYSEKDVRAPNHAENGNMNRELIPNPQIQQAESLDSTHLRADQPIPQSEPLQTVSNLPPFRGVEIPQAWHRQDQNTLIGRATTFSDPDIPSLRIVSQQHTKPIDPGALDAFSQLLETKANAASTIVNTPDVLSSIAPVLGTSLVGDNQLTDVAKPGTIYREPAFNLDDAQVRTLNGRNVLAVSGWSVQKDDQGQPKTELSGAIAKRYYAGIFGLDPSRKGVVSELYVTADDAATFQKGKANFNKALGSIEWK